MGYSNIPESLLEMHYFRLLVMRYTRLLGRNIQIFKPTTTAEHWFGFDQAFFMANASQPKVINGLRSFVQSNVAPPFTSFRAFLLQFKVVEKMRVRSAYSPTGWKAPYYRAELYLKPNVNTGISQHETLRRLSGLRGASVAYVCPMIFDASDVVKTPKYSDLQFVDVSSAPPGWLPNGRHFIAFQQTSSTPTWCSAPIVGKRLASHEIFERAKPLQTEELFEMLEHMRSVLTEPISQQNFVFYLNGGEPNVLPPCLSIVAEY